MTAIKICGVRDSKTCDLLVELQVDWVGFVFYPASPRYITAEQVSQLPDYKQEGLSRVGLFVEPTIDEIVAVLESVRLDILQVYASMEQAHAIQEQIKMPIWVAKGIQTTQDLPISCSVDGLVIEAPANKEDSRPGGNGRVFDWRLTAKWRAPKPWILAGGLTPDNVTEAIQQSGTKAVDVSSGVEGNKGVKDLLLVRRFVENIRQFDHNH